MAEVTFYLMCTAKFQKGSPYLEDANSLLQLSSERGFKFALQDPSSIIPNMTKCNTWDKVRDSHLKQDRKELMTYEDILGMLLLWTIGLGTSFLVFMLEVASQLCHKQA